MSDFSDQSFIQGFLEEADEHLETITGVLLALEKPAGQAGAATPSEQVSVLYRALHSIKGLSTMVGLMPAADLSHAMESVVREIQQNRLEISPLVIDSLLEATKTLLAVVDTLRATGDPSAPVETPGTDIHAQSALLEQLAERARLALVPATSRAEVFPDPGQSTLEPAHLPPEIKAILGEVEQRQITQAQAAGKSVYVVIFAPSNELAAQGINVTTIRQQLTAHYQMLKALPLVDGKNVRFIFLIASESPLDLPPQGLPSAGLEWISLGPAPRAENATPVGGHAAPHAPRLPTMGQATSAFTPSIRVDIQRLDEVMRQMGDLVVTRSRLSETIQRVHGIDAGLEEVLDELSSRIERQVRDLRQTLMRVRLVPLAEVFGRMPLAVRDLANNAGKQVRLVMQGENTEIDKALVDRLLDPLLHLARNAIIHGIETPAERQQAGKDPQGVISLTGHPEGDHVVITVADDGRGINLEQVLQQARQPGHAGPPDMQEVLDTLCRPGFSTRSQVDMGAGRGMGMSVVQQAITAMGGTLWLDTTPGAGTTFTIRLPLTLAIIDALVVTCGSERYAIPQSAISEAIEIDPAQVTAVMEHELVTLRGAPLPLIRLQRVFHVPPAAAQHAGIDPGERVMYGLLTGMGEARVALVVDRISGLREAVIRPISDPLIARPGIAGATELGDGSLVLVLDVPGVLRASRNGKAKRKGSAN